MTTPARRSAAENDYVMTVYRQLTAMFGRRFEPRIAEELVQEECHRLLERLAAAVEDYPDPVVYAKVRATGRHALLGMMRSDDVQAGRGARRGRIVIDGEARSGGDHERPGHTAYEQYAHRCAGSHDDLAELMARHQQVRDALAPLSARARTLLYLVDGQGCTVTEAAARLRIARETAARIRSAALRRLAAAC